MADARHLDQPAERQAAHAHDRARSSASWPTRPTWSTEVLPDYPPLGQAHAAGQRLVPHAPARQRRAGERAGSRGSSRARRGHRRRATSTRPTSSCSPPGSTRTSSSGRWRSPAAASGCTTSGARTPRLPRHHHARVPEPLLPLRPEHQPGRRAAWSSCSSARSTTSSRPRRLLERAWYASMECRRDVHDEYNERVDAEHEQHGVASPARCTATTTTMHGRVTTNAPWRLIDYWRMTRHPDLADFVPSDPGG